MQSPEFHCSVGTTVYPDLQSLVLTPCCFSVGPEDVQGSNSAGWTQRKRNSLQVKTQRGLEPWRVIQPLKMRINPLSKTPLKPPVLPLAEYAPVFKDQENYVNTQNSFTVYDTYAFMCASPPVNFIAVN